MGTSLDTSGTTIFRFIAQKSTDIIVAIHLMDFLHILIFYRKQYTVINKRFTIVHVCLKDPCGLVGQKHFVKC